MIRTLGTLLVCALLLSGCATMNKNECRNADWDMIGYEDASRGHAVVRIGQHRKACAKVDVTPDMAAYERGHERGARVYCTRERGYREGVNGAAYQGICPADLAPAFTRAHKDGLELYHLRQRISATASALAGYRETIARLQSDISAAEKSIVDSSSTSISRREKLLEIKEMQQQITELEVFSVGADQELLMLEQDQQAILRQHQEWGY